MNIDVAALQGCASSSAASRGAPINALRENSKTRFIEFSCIVYSSLLRVACPRKKRQLSFKTVDRFPRRKWFLPYRFTDETSVHLED